MSTIINVTRRDVQDKVHVGVLVPWMSGFTRRTIYMGEDISLFIRSKGRFLFTPFLSRFTFVATTQQRTFGDVQLGLRKRG